MTFQEFELLLEDVNITHQHFAEYLEDGEYIDEDGEWTESGQHIMGSYTISTYSNSIFTD